MSMLLGHTSRGDSSNLDEASVRRRRGVIVVLIALLLPVILAMAAFSVDVTFMQLSRAQLRAATDSSARAAGEALSRLQDTDAARQAAQTFAAANQVGGKSLELADDDIIFGCSARTAADGPWVFDPVGRPINSVRVRGRRTSDSLSGPVRLFFGRAIGTPNFEPVQFATVVNLDRDICLIVDRSSSMKIDLASQVELLEDSLYCQPPRGNTRWTALVESVAAFVAATKETSAREKIGLASYGSEIALCGVTNRSSSIDSPLSEDSNVALNALNGIGSSVFNGNTNIAAGIQAGIQVLTNSATARPYAMKVIVLFTDGKFNEGGTPLATAQIAASQQITIHTITFGVGANQADMKTVASTTGGKHFHALSASALRDVFYEIGASKPTIFIE